MKQQFLALALTATAAMASNAWADGRDHDTHANAKHVQAVEETAVGKSGDAAKVSRIIRVGMDDTMHFSSSEISNNGRPVRAGATSSGDIRLRQGETVKFIVANDGKIMHEMVIGTMKELKAHAELMKKHPGMEHDVPYMAHVAPGRKEEIVWQFTKPGDFNYACLIPGHLEAGMIGKIVVSAAKTPM